MTSKTENTFKIFPNPFESGFQIEVTQAHFEGVKILDVQGKTVYVSEAAERNINLDYLNSGIYFVQDIYSGTTLKIIKR